jgi:hypothetical protein
LERPVLFAVLARSPDEEDADDDQRHGEDEDDDDDLGRELHATKGSERGYPSPSSRGSRRGTGATRQDLSIEPGERRAFWLECTERVEGRSLVKGQQKPKQLAKKAAQKTLKEKRQEKKAKKKAGSGFDH